MANPVRQYREQHNLSRADFAKKARCSIAFVGHLENGIRVVSATTAVNWEKRFGIPRHELRPDYWSAPKLEQVA